MKYNTDIDTLEAFYDTLYSVPSRLNRHSVTPQAVTGRLLEELDNPHKGFRSILITGSKGKGSTALFLSALVNASGLRVGQFSSPHLLDYRERIVVDGTMIKPDELLRLARQVFAAANAMEINHPDEFPRFFEITTAIAYLYFSLRYVDIAVIETGIGAQTDATNQGTHELSILTHIEDEHGDIFGTLEGIAKEKSGVIKADTPLVLGDLAEEIDQIILNHAAELNVPVTRFKRRHIPNNHGYYQVKVGAKPWITDSQLKAQNAWIALTAFDKLDLQLSDERKAQALNNTELPARQEVVSLKPFIIIDSAHSSESAQRLANYVNKSVSYPVRKTVLLLSFSAEKNILPVFSAFVDNDNSDNEANNAGSAGDIDVDKVVLTQATETRSLSPEAIAEKLEDHTNAKIKLIADPQIALQKTMKKLKPNDVLIITGSVYLAGLMSQQFNQK